MSDRDPINWQAAALQALRAYALPGEAVSMQALNLTNNINIRVHLSTDASGLQTYVLRIQRRAGGSSAMLASELAWLEALRADTDLLVPSPVPTATGSLFGKVMLGDQQHFFTLFGWLDCRFLTTDRQDAAHAEQVGALLGGLHRHARGFVPGPGFVRPRLDAGQLLDRAAVDSAQLAGLFSAQQVRVLERATLRAGRVMRALNGRPDALGLIHADLIWKNYFFHPRGAGALDFDDCRWSYYLYDLAPTLVGYYDEPHYAALRAGLLAGYRRVSPLPAADEPLLEVLMAARHVVSCCWLARRLDDPALRSRAPAIVAYRVAMIDELLGNR